MPFAKILIANRGEIAVRIMRTARALGYRTVAVYSDADAGALHVAAADEAVRIGPPPARESYLDQAALLAAAKQSGADAVHPGYGFLSENDSFAAACVAADLVWIGPPPAAIHAMGNKAAAKRLMLEAGVPCVPGYQGADQSDAKLRTEAGRIGYPVMVKAAAGGGGRGMRLVTAAGDIDVALTGARSEAENAFGSGELILEKAIVDSRHVEIQVFADAHGAVLHLGERDCSVQRRHQKVIEEAPSPAVTPELRAKMGAAAVAAARAVGYRGAGTVEFLLDASGAFYFLEMNTRLQVEHPVTEAITGFDLVAWQLRVAAGEAFTRRQEQITFQGHAIEVRLCAEDPTRNFLPQVGRIAAWAPAERAGVRTDHGLHAGQEISPHYDSMLAKVIAHGATREEARRRLIAALEDMILLGPVTNRAFLIDMLRHPEFAAGRATTGFIPAHFPQKSAAMRRPVPEPAVLALAAALLFERTRGLAGGETEGWTSTGVAAAPMRIEIGGERLPVVVVPAGRDRYRVSAGEAETAVHLTDRRDPHVRFAVDGHMRSARFAFAGDTLHLDVAGRTFAVRDTLYDATASEAADGDGNVLAPMNGRVVAVLAKAGDAVTKGQRLIVLEAMKMQHELVAGRAGRLAQVPVKVGDQVATRQLLAALAVEAAKA